MATGNQTKMLFDAVNALFYGIHLVYVINFSIYV